MRGMTFLLGVWMTGTLHAAALTPFTAHYQVFEGGKAVDRGVWPTAALTTAVELR